jgi:hypothetical protein
MKKQRSRHLIRLDKWLHDNDIEPLDFLRASFTGEAPPVVILADQLYLDNADESLWRMKVGAKASRRSINIAAQVVTDAR